MAKSIPRNKSAQPDSIVKITTKNGVVSYSNFITWIEIPAYDFKRSLTFYNHVYNIEMETSEVNGYSMAIFPTDSGLGGAIICGDGSHPSEKGPLVYLHAKDGINIMLKRIEAAGGRVLLGKTAISEYAGCFALFLDTEGNKLALHEK